MFGLSLIGFGAVMTTVSDAVGAVIAGLGVAWEGFLLWRAGR